MFYASISLLHNYQEEKVEESKIKYVNFYT